MNWLYNGKEVTEEETQPYVGFVYMITNKTDGRKF